MNTLKTNTKAAHTTPVQSGLRVRTDLRAGASNPLQDAANTVQSWWQSLFGGAQAGAADSGMSGQA